MSAWDGVIRRYRQVNGLTQAALAEAIGVEQATISRWERGTHTPELNTQRRLRDLLTRSPVIKDCLVYHRVRTSMVPMKLADRDGRNRAASSAAAALHGIQARKLQTLHYRDLFTDVLEKQWQEILSIGFFEGNIASVSVVNPWKTAGHQDIRYCRSCWTPAILSDGEVLLVSEFHDIDELTYMTASAPASMRVTTMEDLLA
jgi:transcriptional regulator with XRE-family HTH domain